MPCLTSYLLILVLAYPILQLKIARLPTGDLFDITEENTCHLYKASCAVNDCGFWLPCCTRCRCVEGETFYDDFCHANLGSMDLSK